MSHRKQHVFVFVAKNGIIRSQIPLETILQEMTHLTISFSHNDDVEQFEESLQFLIRGCYS